MLSKVHATIRNRRFLTMAIIISFIAVFVFGYTLPKYRAFAENETVTEQSENISKEAEATIQADSDAVSKAERSAEIRANSDVVKESEKEATISAGSDEGSAKADTEKEEIVNKDSDNKDTDENKDADASVVPAGEAATVTAEIKGFKVQVNVPERAFNEEVTLVVKEAVESKEDAINEEEDVIELTKEQIKALKRLRNVYGSNLDIAFINEDEKEVEPKEELGVNIEMDENLFSKSELKSIENFEVFHLAEGKDGKVESIDIVAGTDVEEKKVKKDEENTNSITYNKEEEKVIAEFVTEDFSIYTINTNNTDFKFYFLDKGNLNNENFGTTRGTTMPQYNTSNFLVQVDYANGRYTVEPNGQGWQNQQNHDLMIPFGFRFDRAVAMRSYKDNTTSTLANRIANNSFNINKFRLSSGWELQKADRNDFESAMYSQNGNNRYMDYAGIYERLTIDELPMYVVAEGTTTSIVTFREFMNSTDYSINGATGNNDSNKYSVEFYSDHCSAFRQDHSTFQKDGVTYNYKRAYIQDESGNKTIIKCLRYEGQHHQWFYSTSENNASSNSNMTMLTNNYTLFVEFEPDQTDVGIYKGKFHIQDKDNKLTNGEYQKLKDDKEFIGRGYYEIVLNDTDGYYIEKDENGNKIESTRKSLYEYFGVDPSQQNYVTARIRHASSGAIDGNGSNSARVKKIECIDGQMWATMDSGGRQILSNKDIFVLFEDPINLDKVGTIDSTSMGFHVHMFNFPKSAFDNAISGVNGGNAIGNWSSEYRKAFGFDESAGDNRGTFSGDQYEGQTERGLYSRTTKGDGAYEGRFPNVLHAWQPSGYAHYTNENISLGNWFDPKSSQFYVGEANHLFLKNVFDKSGYIYYNSEENAAVLNNAGSDGLMDFDVYKALASPVYTSEADLQYGPGSFFYHRGNFMPFNDIDTTKRYANNKYDADGAEWANSNHTGQVNNDASHKQYNTDKVPYSNTETVYGLKNGRVTGQNSTNPDYFHGMYAYMNFFQPVDGKVKNPESQHMEDMVYEFTGDDDMMVYVDGVLVLDLGGVHDAESGKINFSTGEVTYTMNGSYTPSGTTNRSARLRDGTPTTIKAEFEKAGKAEGMTWKGNTFQNDSYHTIQIFYMERGEGASNLKIKVNIPPVPDASFTVEKKIRKQEGQPETAADKNEEFTMKLQYLESGKDPGAASDSDWKPLSEYRTADNQPAKYYIQGKETYDSNGNVVLTQIGANGVLKLKDGERAIFPGLTRLNQNDPVMNIRVVEITSSRLTNPGNGAANVGDIYEVDYFAIRDGLKDVADINKIRVEIPQNQTGGVLVENEPSSLTIEKLIESASIDSSVVFPVKVEFTMNEGHKNLIGRTFPVVVRDALGNVVENSQTSVTFTNNNGANSASLNIKHGQKITIYNLPKEATYQVTETDTKGYVVSYDTTRTGNLWKVEGDKRKATNASTTITNRQIELTKTNSNGTTVVPDVDFVVNQVGVSGSRITSTDSGIVKDGNEPLVLTTGTDGKINITPLIVRMQNDANLGKEINALYPGYQALMLYENNTVDGYKRASAPWVIMYKKETGEVKIYQHTNRYAAPDATGPNNAKYWDKSKFEENLVTDGKLRNDSEVELELIKVDETTLPKNSNGSYKPASDWTDTEQNGIVKLGGARFRVIEAKTVEPLGNGKKFSNFEVLKDGDNDLILTSEDGTGRIVIPQSMMPNVTPNSHRYFLLEEITAPAGYVKPNGVFAIDVRRDGVYAEDAKVDVYNTSTVITLREGKEWSEYDPIECTTIGNKVMPYTVVPNKPVEITKVSSQEEDKKLVGAKFVIGDAGTSGSAYYGTSWGLIPNKENPIVLESDSQGKIKLTEILRTIGRDNNGIYNKGVDLGEGKKGYFLYEIEAPTGYQIAKAPWMLIVDSDGNVSLKTNSSTNSDYVERINAGTLIGEGGIAPEFWRFEWAQNKFGNEITDGKIDNTKKPLKLTKVKDGTGVPLENAKFILADVEKSGSNYTTTYSKIIKKNGSPYELISNDKGEMSLEELMTLLSGNVGKHLDSSKINLLLFEKDPPAGHRVATAPWLLTIDPVQRDVVLKKSSGVSNHYTDCLNGYAIDEWGSNVLQGINRLNLDRWKNTYGSTNMTWTISSFDGEGTVINNTPITLRKVDEENQTTGLPNVKFRIYRAQWDSNENYLRNETDLGEFVSDSNGYIDISELYKYLRTDRERTPFLVYETEAATGYAENRPKAPWYISIQRSTGGYRIYRYNKQSTEFADGAWISFYNFVGCYSYSDSIITNKRGKDKLYKLDADSLAGIGGVEFELYDACTVKNNSSKVKICANPVKVTSEENGYIDLGTLYSGYYILRETKKKEGYIKEDMPWIIYVRNGVITEVRACKSTARGNYPNINWTLSNPTVFTLNDFEPLGKHENEFAIYNQKMYNLPSTGGPGTQMFTFFGLTIMALATAMILRTRKEEEA